MEDQISEIPYYKQYGANVGRGIGAAVVVAVIFIAYGLVQRFVFGRRTEGRDPAARQPDISMVYSKSQETATTRIRGGHVNYGLE